MLARGGNVRGFNDRLEALRGIAALWVALGHSFIWLSIDTESAIWAKKVFDIHGAQAMLARSVIAVFSGVAAVDIFFVLSGFVLCRSLVNQSPSVPNYFGFVVKRLFRIFPAFWISLIIVFLYLTLLFPGYAAFSEATRWFNGWYTQPITAQQIIGDATMQPPALNPNAWTLSVELLASLMLPVVVLVIGARGIWSSVAAFAVTFVLAWHYEMSPWSIWHYLYMFVLGVIVSMKAQPDFAKRYSKVLVPGSLAMILAASTFFPLAHTIPVDTLVSVGTALLIWCIDAGSEHSLLKILDSNAARFLGRISYSFYLLHFIVLYAVANAVLHHAPQAWIARWSLPIMASACVISIALALPLSAIVFMCVEKPLTLAGRRLASRRWLPTSAGL
ncbi:acyltransferase family protein [Burkholderia sp. F1]|uniref:acyltransferase family protein n=1 Tax=Burkholderia sp. F1 TaxID=3366817 RepID=UPI003D72009C